MWDFDAVFPFSEGMAAVEYYDTEAIGWVDYEHILGYINRQGEFVIPIIYRHWPGFYSHRGAPPFSHGMVAMQSNDDGGVGIFDTYGQLVMPFYFSDAWMFSEGLMAVRAPYVVEDDSWRSSGWGFIDTTGELVIDYQFRYASAFREGRAAVLSDDWLWGFIDQAGEMVIPYQFRHIDGQGHGFFLPIFSEGLAAINVGESGGWGFIDLHGELVIPAIYSWAWDFSGGYASVSHQEYGSGVVDRDGNFTHWTLLDTESYDNSWDFMHSHGYSDWREFSHGLAAVAIGEGNDWSTPDNRRWGFIDQDGNIVVPIEFHAAQSFSEGLAWVRQGRWWGIIEIIG